MFSRSVWTWWFPYMYVTLADVAEWIACLPEEWFMSRFMSHCCCPPLLGWGMSGKQACRILTYTVYTPIKAGIVPDVTLRFNTYKQERVQRTFKTHGDGHMKSKIGVINDLIKWTLVQQKFSLKNLGVVQSTKVWYCEGWNLVAQIGRKVNFQA